MLGILYTNEPKNQSFGTNMKRRRIIQWAFVVFFHWISFIFSCGYDKVHGTIAAEKVITKRREERDDSAPKSGYITKSEGVKQKAIYLKAAKNMAALSVPHAGRSLHLGLRVLPDVRSADRISELQDQAGHYRERMGRSEILL